MKIVGLILAFISFGSGLLATYYWYRASKVGISPGWTVESGELDRNIMGWVTGCMIAFTESGNLNKRAAGWTALAVASGAIASFIPFLAQIA